MVDTNLVQCRMVWCHAVVDICQQHHSIFCQVPGSGRPLLHSTTSNRQNSAVHCGHIHVGLGHCGTGHRVPGFSTSDHLQQSWGHHPQICMNLVACHAPLPDHCSQAAVSTSDLDRHFSTMLQILSMHRLHVPGNYYHPPAFRQQRDRSNHLNRTTVNSAAAFRLQNHD